MRSPGLRLVSLLRRRARPMQRSRTTPSPSSPQLDSPRPAVCLTEALAACLSILASSLDVATVVPPPETRRILYETVLATSRSADSAYLNNRWRSEHDELSQSPKPGASSPKP